MARKYTPKGEGLSQSEVNSRKKSYFLRVYLENGGFMERAIRECHTSKRFITQQMEEDEDFAAAVQYIRDINNESIEHEIYRRAVTGNAKPLAYQGKLTGDVVMEYSDNLLMFYAKAHMPNKYRDLPQGKGVPLTEEELNDALSKFFKGREPKLLTEEIQ